MGEPQPIASSPTGSLEDDQQIHESTFQESPFLADEYDPFPQDQKKKSRRSSGHSGILRRASKKAAEIALESPVEVAMEKDDAELSLQQQFTLDRERMDDVPSCTDALRQHWAATVLRVRFGLFHAKRRLSRRRRSSPT